MPFLLHVIYDSDRCIKIKRLPVISNDLSSGYSVNIFASVKLIMCTEYFLLACKHEGLA